MSRAIAETEGVAHHVASCAAAIYHSLGRFAPTCTDDGACVFLYEVARRAGRWRHEADALAPHRRGTDPEPVVAHGAVADAFATAATDATGCQSIAVLCHVVGPRFLVTLRDVQAGASEASEGPLVALCQAIQWEVVGILGEGGRVLAERVTPADTAFATSLGAIDEALVAAGCADSLGRGVAG